jgi:hypothetical protein
MLRSLALLMMLSSPGLAQTVVGPNAVPLGVYVDLDSNNNVTTIYGSRQDPVAHPATTWIPINDARIQAYYAARTAISTAGSPPIVPATGVPQQ